MKALKTVLLATLLLVAVSVAGWAQVNASKASIIGSPHDFTNDTWSATAGGTAAAVTTNTCFFCHIIHKTNTNSSGIATSETLAPGYLLWNHQLSSTASYGVYSSDTFNNVLQAAGVTAPTDLGASNNITSPTVSNLCLSCHDGTVAIGSFYEGGFGLPANGSYWNNGHGNSLTMYTGMQIDNLAKSHPVNFVYNANLAAAGQLTVPASLNSVDANGAVPLYGNAGLMECTTCHDPHNGTTIAHGTAVPFARLALQNAENTKTGGYCTYCHL
jgi:cytochrome c553